MNTHHDVLVVEDDRMAGKTIAMQLKDRGYRPHFVESAEEALVFFRQNNVDLVLLDYMLPGMSGEDFYTRIKEINPVTPVIFMTAVKSVDKAVKLLKMGAFTYLTKPLQMEELLHNVANALEKVALVNENRRLQETLQQNFSFDRYVFFAEKMQPVMNMVMRAAGSNSNILISGESGTGKDVIANIIHHYSKRKKNVFIRANLAAIPETLIEAELFGSVKGAYTGAVENRRGRFEEARGGTLFLDEIAELSPTVQVKLLRVIQDREITRLGTNDPVKVDIRLITATNKNLRQLVEDGKFREDLFYRLNVIDINLPPLRSRKEDIPHLIDLFIKKYNQREGKEIKSISREALNALMVYGFPGNIRELENIIERSLVLATSDILVKSDLPVFVGSFDKNGSDLSSSFDGLALPDRMSMIEKNILEKTLKKHNYHQTRTAEELGISEARLRYKLRTLGIARQES